MNLIEQLGGYEATKEKYQTLSDSDMITIGPVEFSAKDYFEDELLEYRRHHNIFEVGDKVVLLNWDNNSKIYSIGYVYEHKIYKGSEYSYSTFIYLLDGWSNERWFNNRKIRHATDAEIEAGRRLEVNQ